MDHTHEGHRNFTDITKQYLVDNNWKTLLKPNTTVVDIGAHSGDTTIIMGAMTGSTVLAVECNPHIMPWTEFACNMNQHLAKFVLAHEAVTTEDNVEVTFADHGNNMCNGGLVGGISDYGIKLPGLTLESICKKYLSDDEISKIDLIKIDTEGHDFLILDGSRDFIDTVKPKLFVEWFSQFNQEQSNAIFDIIESLDYVALYPKTLERANSMQRSDDLLLIHKSKI
jgi:FkbM family methyltransferase